MPEFLVEVYVSRADAAAVDVIADRARRTAAPVRFVRAVYVPEEETCFYLYEAERAEDVRRAADRAGLPAHHVVEAITQSRGENT